MIAALRRLRDFRPFVIPGPIRMVQRLKTPYTPETLEALSHKPWVEVLDPQTVVFKAQNVVEAFARRCGLDYTWPGR